MPALAAEVDRVEALVGIARKVLPRLDGLLAGDRNGVSFYGRERICATIEISLDDFIAARNGLIDKDLVAFDGTRFQVLALRPAPVLPPRPPLVTDDDFEQHDPATVRRIVRGLLDR